MWYVNTQKSVLFIIYCYSFILTMWYVNKGEPGTPADLSDCFILTMWYVNLYTYPSLSVSNDVLY